MQPVIFFSLASAATAQPAPATIRPSFSTIRYKTLNPSILTCYALSVSAAMLMRTLPPGWVYGTRRPRDFFSGSISISSRPLVRPAPAISGSLTERRFRPCRKGSPNSFTAHAPEISRRSGLSPLECAVGDKHRVLPVFTRSCQHSSPLEATLVSIPVSVDSKWLTEKLSPLDATLTKNTGGGVTSFKPKLLSVRHVPPVRPIAAERLWCHNSQRHEISSASEETTPLLPVSKDSERTSGTVRQRSRLPRLGRGCKVIALRSHLQEGLGPSFYCWTAAGGPSIASGVDRLTVAIEKDAGKCRAGKAGSVRLG